MELAQYQKNPDIRIDWETLQAWAFDYNFKINPSGHTKENKDKIRAIQNEYKKQMLKTVKEFDELKQNDIYEEASEKILQIGLVDFDYETFANNPDIGPTVLGQLATELAHFLVVQGGKAGFKHWQMQQKLAMLNLSSHSNSLKD